MEMIRAPKYQPKWKYKKGWTIDEVKNPKSEFAVLCKSEAHEKFLGPDWKDSPAEIGVTVYPHPSDYLAERELHDFDEFHEEQEMVKAKRGRPPTKKEASP